MTYKVSSGMLSLYTLTLTHATNVMFRVFLVILIRLQGILVHLFSFIDYVRSHILVALYLILNGWICKYDFCNES